MSKDINEVETKLSKKGLVKNITKSPIGILLFPEDRQFALSSIQTIVEWILFNTPRDKYQNILK